MRYSAVVVPTVLVLPVACSRDEDEESTEAPPPDSKSLSEIVQMMEQQGFRPVVEVEFEDDYWHLAIYKEGEKLELWVHPVSAKIVSERVGLGAIPCR